jgi:hypothetical protein
LFFYQKTKLEALADQSVVQFLFQHQGQEAAEDMPSDGLIPLVKDGAGVNHRLHIPEGLLHHPEFLVFKRDFFCLELRVGGQHPDAVVSDIGLDLFFIQG